MRFIVEEAILVQKKNFPKETISKKRPEWWVWINVLRERTRYITCLGRETERKPTLAECVEWREKKNGKTV
jgi:hypothetical protein